MVYDLISLRTVKELCLAGALRDAIAVAIEGGFAVQFSYGQTVKTLQARRGHLRLFKTLDAAAKIVRSIGLSEMRSTFENWSLKNKEDSLEKARTESLKSFDKALDEVRASNTDLSEEDAMNLVDEALDFARQSHKKTA